MRSLVRYALNAGALGASLAGCSSGFGMHVTPANSPGADSLAPSAFGGRVTLYKFRGGRSGASPEAVLLFHNGLLYGTASDAYIKGDGTIFSIDGFGNVRILYAFRGNPDGEDPQGSLIWYNGAFYGTTARGGSYGLGTVFTVTAHGFEQVIHSFGGRGDGAFPAAGLVAYNGTLYGTTQNGGRYRRGTVFKIDSLGHERILHSFAGSPNDGGHPTAPLIVYKGALYGTTRAGGMIASGGTVYKITPLGAERVLHSFGESRFDGSNPAAPLVALNRTFFGTTLNGGLGKGTVFSVDANGSERMLYAFDGDFDGAFPVAGLVAVGGWLYGTTMNGGLSGTNCLSQPGSGLGKCGTVFKVHPISGQEEMLYQFRGYPDGANPEAGLTYAGGTLYGTTAWGGSRGNFGIVFRSAR